jgi:hypothetical protein
LESKIINMAEKIKDPTDQLLETMFRSEPVADDGFSDRVLTRVNRAAWVRRLALPIAMVAGAAVAVKPAGQLVEISSRILSLLPAEVASVPLSLLPQLPTVIMGGMLFAVGLVFIQSLAE